MGGKGRSQAQQHSSPTVSAPEHISPHLESQNQLGNAEVQQRMQGNQSDVDCSEAQMPTPMPANGELSYYRARHDDFLNRYHFCGLTPPVYYLGYGDKYVRRFTFETQDRLTPKGKAWLARARVLLQVSIEDELIRDPAAFDRLERNDAAFTRFAYDTHPDAYWDAGLGELDLFDLTNIGLTPDARDLFGWDGIVQVADIGSRLGEVWGSNAIDMLHGEGSAEMTANALHHAYRELGQDIDEVFGEGTAHVMEQTVIQAGNGLVNIGQSLHGAAGHAANTAIDISDSIFGKGSTEEAINDVGTMASDASDWVEDRYRSARRWASEFTGSWE